VLVSSHIWRSPVKMPSAFPGLEFVNIRSKLDWEDSRSGFSLARVPGFPLQWDC
jgi:hypothetical protein